jgi:hypothetical protein
MYATAELRNVRGLAHLGADFPARLTPDMSGAVHSVFEICTSDTLNHRLEVCAGILEDESRELMQAFFRERRPRPRSDAEG